jgi:hypothetical protein
MNNWTPNKLKIARVNWTEERTRAYRMGGGCKQTGKPNAKGVSKPNYKR